MGAAFVVNFGLDSIARLKLKQNNNSYYGVAKNHSATVGIYTLLLKPTEAAHLIAWIQVKRIHDKSVVLFIVEVDWFFFLRCCCSRRWLWIGLLLFDDNMKRIYNYK